MSTPQKTPLTCPKAALFLEGESSSPNGRGCWFARVPADHTIDDVLHPSYFGAHQHQKGIRSGDLIDIEPESAAWRIQVRVMALIPSVGQVKVREAVNQRQIYEVTPPKGFEFKWEGLAGKWSVYRDGVAISGGYDTQDECMARVAELRADMSVAA